MKDEVEECFNAVGEFGGDQVQCEHEIQNSVNRYLEEKRQEIILRTNSLEISTCFFGKLKSQERYTNTILLVKVLEHTEISWKLWLYFERNARLKEVKESLEVTEKAAENICRESVKKIAQTTERFVETTPVKPTLTTQTPTTTTEKPIETTEQTVKPFPTYADSEESGDHEVVTLYSPTTTTEEDSEDSNEEISEAPPNTILINEDGSGGYDDEYDDEDNIRAKRKVSSGLEMRSIHSKDDDFIFQA